MGFGTDEHLWYNNGIFGQLGYAVPNFGNDPSTLNSGIFDLVDIMGKNLFAIMKSDDADMTVPPSINTMVRVHRLINRARTIMANRARPLATPELEGVHVTPAEHVFLIYPIPFFKVRNRFLREVANYGMFAISEAIQHTENRKSFDYTTQFSGLIGQYLQRVYRTMATEFFGVPLADANKPDFTLTDAQLAAYDPSKYFTPTEMVDTVPKFANVPTEDDLVVLATGIPATQLVGLAKYPGGAAVGAMADATVTAASSNTAPTSFAPAPSP